MCRGVNDLGGPWRCAAHTRDPYISAISGIESSGRSAESARQAGTQAVVDYACTPSGREAIGVDIEDFEDMGQVETAMWLRSCLKQGETLAEAHKDVLHLEKAGAGAATEPGSGSTCGTCGNELIAETHTGLCRDCFIAEFKNEGLLMGMSEQDAVKWASDEAEFDVKSDDLDLDDGYDVFGADAYTIPGSSAQGALFKEPEYGGSTKYGYDDFDSWEDYRAAERKFGLGMGLPGRSTGSYNGGGWNSTYPASTLPYVDYKKKYFDEAKETGKPVSVSMGSAKSGDGYVYFPDGTRRWGVYGASGVMLRHIDGQGTERFFLAQRGGSVDGGNGQWAIPGGALDQGETALQGAMREFREEIKTDTAVTVIGEHRDEVDEAWAYTSVVADVPEMFTPPEKLDWETKAVGWFTRQEIAGLPKHPGFESTLPFLLDRYDAEKYEV